MTKILVVDDEPDILDITRMILKKSGYKVVTATDGEEALEKAEAEKPDLILLDIVLPSMSGFEVCKAIKENVKTSAIPVVIFSVLGREVDRDLALKAGADGYLVKPFFPQELVDEIKKYLYLAGISKSRSIYV